MLPTASIPTSLPSVPSADRDIAAATEHALLDLLRFDPVLSSRVGAHAHDGAFADCSPEGRHTRRAALAAQVHALEGKRSMDPEVELDRRLLLSELKVTLRTEEDLDPARRSPVLYAQEVLTGLTLLLRPPVAPRLGALLGRLRDVGRFLRQGQAALAPADVPRPWAELGVAMARGGLPLLTEALPAAVREAVGDTPLAAAICAAAGEAALHLSAYANFVEERVLPHAYGEVAAGDSLFTFLLHQRHGVREDAEALLRMGQEEALHAEAALHEAAGRHRPGMPWQVALRALEGETFMPDDVSISAVCQELLVELRRAGAGRFPAPPVEEALVVSETPQCFRGLVPFAGYLPPTPLGMDEVPLRGVLWVTPGNRVTRQELLLACAHEGYPGHHLQHCHAAALGSRTRRVLGAPALTAGWSLYCEGLLEEMGLMDPALELLVQRGRLWRGLRVALDVELHCGGLSQEEAASQLMGRLGFTREQALAEVRRYTLQPTQPLTYLLGARALWRLRAAAEARPDFSALRFHREVLRHGALPLPYLEHAVQHGGVAVTDRDAARFAT